LTFKQLAKTTIIFERLQTPVMPSLVDFKNFDGDLLAGIRLVKKDDTQIRERLASRRLVKTCWKTLEVF